MVIANRDEEKISFNITRKDKDTGEIEIQLNFADPKNISNNIKGDVIDVILTQRIVSETRKLYSYLEKGQYASKRIPPQIS